VFTSPVIDSFIVMSVGPECNITEEPFYVGGDPHKPHNAPHTFVQHDRALKSFTDWILAFPLLVVKRVVAHDDEQQRPSVSGEYYGASEYCRDQVGMPLTPSLSLFLSSSKFALHRLH
jgi:hypothetical protein